VIYTLTLNPALDRELTVDTIRFDSVLRATETRIDCGGKGFNVSRMLASLGIQSVAMGYAGGRTGETLQAGLTALGIETDFVWVDGETRTNISIVSTTDPHHIKVNEAGPSISEAARVALLERVATRLQAGDWWVLAGSLPPGLPVTIYADLIRLIQDAGAFAVLDSSGEPFRHGIAASPRLVKPNDNELSQWSGLPVTTPQEAMAAASTLIGVEIIVVSLGAQGAILISGAESWVATPPLIQAGNPIGAGDSMVAGLLWALNQGNPLSEVLRWGVACGAATASNPGTTVGTSAQVTTLATQVGMQAIPFKHSAP
jgi:1-phosphofructokinase family hexose kinase